MAIRTTSTTARSSSYSTQRAPQKPSSAQRSSSTQRASTPTQSKQTSSAPRRDTFTYSSPTAKQTAPKTSTAKTSTAPKTTQTKTSTTKTNTAAKTSTAKTATTTKSTSAASNKNRDTFTYTSPAAKTAVKLTQKGTVSAQKNTKVNQTKTAVKNNASNKTAVSGSLSKNKTKSAQNTVPEGLKLHLKHTTDPKQKREMQKTIEKEQPTNIYEPSEFYYVQGTNGYPNNCCITSLATMVSHNTNKKIEPSDSNISVGMVTINNKEYSRIERDASDYNSNDKGYYSYACTSVDEIINIAENELNNGRWVQVYTEYENKSNDQHWVTIVGFDSNSSWGNAVGFDPGYDYGKKPKNLKNISNKNGSQNLNNKSGSVYLNSKGENSYIIRTFNP